MGQHDNPAQAWASWRTTYSAITRAVFHQSEAGDEVLYGLVCGAAFNPQSSREPPVHPQQSAASTPAGGKAESECRWIHRCRITSGMCNSRERPVSAPVIRSRLAETEIWVLANVSDFAYMNVQPPETATGRHGGIAMVGTTVKRQYRGRISADRRQWHAAAHSTGGPIRDCSDDTTARRSRSRCGARRRRKDDHRARRVYDDETTILRPCWGASASCPQQSAMPNGLFVPNQVLARRPPRKEARNDPLHPKVRSLGGYTSFVRSR